MAEYEGGEVKGGLCYCGLSPVRRKRAGVRRDARSGGEKGSVARNK